MIRETPRQLVADFLRQEQLETQDLTDHIKDVVKRLDYRAIIVVGDDDTLHYSAYLSQQGLPVIAIPKTIHNNINGTDYTLGFSTGLARGVSFIHELRALAGSREQIVVTETFAAKSGYSTLLMGLLSGADRVLIPEEPYDPDRLTHLALQDRSETPANYAVVLVCDGTQVQPDKLEKYSSFLASIGSSNAVKASAGKLSSTDEQNLIGSGMVAAKLISHISGEEVLLQPLTYLLRTGSPDGQDLLGAANFAMLAARLLHEGKYGRMAAFVQNKMWTDVDLKVALEGVKTVDINQWYDAENYKPKLSLIWSVENTE